MIDWLEETAIGTAFTFSFLKKLFFFFAFRPPPYGHSRHSPGQTATYRFPVLHPMPIHFTSEIFSRRLVMARPSDAVLPNVNSNAGFQAGVGSLMGLGGWGPIKLIKAGGSVGVNRTGPKDGSAVGGRNSRRMTFP